MLKHQHSGTVRDGSQGAAKSLRPRTPVTSRLPSTSICVTGCCGNLQIIPAAAGLRPLASDLRTLAAPVKPEFNPVKPSTSQYNPVQVTTFFIFRVAHPAPTLQPFNPSTECLLENSTNAQTCSQKALLDRLPCRCLSEGG